ncbi:unnamed protein product, partial [Phaeothamnion confervicola]
GGPTAGPWSGGGGGGASAGGHGGGGSAGYDAVVERPRARYSDLGGIACVLQEVRELIEYPLLHPEVYAHLGIEPPRGILLHGPPGCGKTLLAHAIAGELGVAFLRISAPEIVSGMSGESEQKVRDLFAAAAEAAPAIIFMDEVDAITPKRENAARGMEKRIVAQLLTCMDSLGGLGGGNGGGGESGESSGGGSSGCSGGGDRRKTVMVIGATNRPNDLDPALRRAGRFDREICLGVPDQAARVRILRVMTAKMRLSGEFDFDDIAKRTPGYVGADLSSLTKEAAVVAINRIFGGLRGAAAGASAIDLGPAAAPVGVAAGVAAAAAAAATAAATVAAGAAAGAAAAAVTSEAVDGAVPAGANGPVAMQDGCEGAVEINQTTADAAADADADADATAVDTEAAAAAAAVEAAAAAAAAPPRTAPLTSIQLAPLFVTMDDFVAAVGKVQPSAKREGFATAPDVSWRDVGALAAVREELELSLLEPIACPERYVRLGLRMPAGVLLYGPPGCGKTLLAKAIANESGANFISVKGPELLDKYVGESERAVRQVFQRAGASSPCIIFFDELDALCPRRGGDGGGGGSMGSGGGGGGGVSERVVNQLLTEMDGLEARRGVFVVAATNRPELTDAAMLRPGRL